MRGLVPTTTVGDLVELEAIAVCVSGGTRLKGGRGTVLEAPFGALTIASLVNGMALPSVLSETKFIVRAVVLVVAMGVAITRRRKGSVSRLRISSRLIPSVRLWKVRTFHGQPDGTLSVPIAHFPTALP